MNWQLILQQLSFGGSVFLIGFSVVFICLILLMGYITVQSLFFKEKKNKAAKADKKEKEVSNDFVGQIKMDENELVAAISAAVAAYMGTSAGNVVVRSYRRVRGNTPAWRRAGIADQISNKY